MESKGPQFSALLADAVSKPGVLSQAYSAFHSYSIGNQMGALFQCQARQALEVSQVPFAMADGNCQGYASGREIAISPVAEFPHKTRFHEIAHIVLGHTAEATMTDSERTPKDIREVEAESTAYILCALLGLPGEHESRGYIQHWLAGNSVPERSAQRIFSAADKILKAGAVVQS